MSREIKFRAWDKKSRVMLNDDIYPKGERDWDQWEQSLDVMLNVIEMDFDLAQYTGLKDMNGVEIYEGDLIKFGPPRETFIPLEPSDTVAAVIFTYAGFNAGGNGLGEVTDWHKCQVIGNIYENPELLEI